LASIVESIIIDKRNHSKMFSFLKSFRRYSTSSVLKTRTEQEQNTEQEQQELGLESGLKYSNESVL